jgi:DNA (cytosine-5)-methyltransferase 1
MIFGSVCSGIEAASTAWEPLGWRGAWFSEIEPFPSAALAHHWPETPNLGDFTTISDRIASWEVPAPEVLVGGTPCQAFSVAGLRQSMGDSRGQLTLEFVRLANGIDAARSLLGIPECIVVWENVPGVLNTPDNAFGCFLAGLAGEDDPLLPPGGRWSNTGRVLGPSRAVAWRILDAQYFGVAQRRRRVFVVASARKGFDPREILFEFDGVRRDSSPRRETGKGFAAVAGTLAASGGGMERPAGNANELDFCIPANGSHWDGGPHPSLNQSNNIGGVGMSNQEIFSQRGAYLAPHPVAAMAHGQGGAEIREDSSPTLTCNHEAPIVFVSQGFHGDVARTLTARHDSSPCADRGMDVVAVGIGALTPWDTQKDRVVSEYGIAPTLNGADGGGGRPSAGAGSVLQAAQVRRLTPTECERLQGFPDGHTRIPWRGRRAEDCPDGPRYKALGNSMAVPVMRWIGERIEKAVDR